MIENYIVLKNFVTMILPFFLQILHISSHVFDAGKQRNVKGKGTKEHVG